jgi:hypothetical protein
VYVEELWELVLLSDPSHPASNPRQAKIETIEKSLCIDIPPINFAKYRLNRAEALLKAIEDTAWPDLWRTESLQNVKINYMLRLDWNEIGAFDTKRRLVE